MANSAKLTVRVSSSRGASSVQFKTNGRYVSLPTNGIDVSLPRQPIQPTTSEKAFWQSVLAIVTTDLGSL